MGSKYKPIEEWIEKWGIMLDWEAKAELRKTVGEALQDVYDEGYDDGCEDERKEGVD